MCRSTIERNSWLCSAQKQVKLRLFRLISSQYTHVHIIETWETFLKITAADLAETWTEFQTGRMSRRKVIGSGISTKNISKGTLTAEVSIFQSKLIISYCLGILRTYIGRYKLRIFFHINKIINQKSYFSSKFEFSYFTFLNIDLVLVIIFEACL